MSDFTREFIFRNDISFIGMRNTARSFLPKDHMEQDKLYQDLKRGKDILDDEMHLNMYLKSFGKMHKAKLDAAFDCLPDISSIFSEGIEIYDWGCGQGTASICLLDFLRSKNIAHNIIAINLIDPSIPATRRAREVLSCYENIRVNAVNKVFDDLDEQDFVRSNHRKLHLFSNILDVDAFDLAQFTHLFQKSFFGSNYFVCVGPYYYNNKRVDEFIAATDPDDMYATFNKERGMWQNDWTISLRIFFKEFSRIENILDIRRRIEDFHKNDQFFAGYILDSVAEEYAKSDIEKETEELFKSLSAFDVKSNKSLESTKNCDPKLAVLANIVSRGLPTIAPVEIETIFSDIFDISTKPQANEIINFKSKHKISKTEINEALHVVDPRFDVAFYNGDMLESQFEKDFVEKYLNRADSQYLIQLLEPQRPLSTIVNIPDKRFSRDQRVDFSFEMPYGETKTGFIFELDGVPYHSNIFQKLRDESRDQLTADSGWNTYRLEELKDYSFLQNWEQEVSLNKYLTTIKRNSQKHITGKWKDTRQIVLSPLAIARIERTLLQALLSGAVNLASEKWKILVIERDVPCATIAISLLQKSFEKISAMDGSNMKLPPIELTVVSTKEFADSKLHMKNAIETSVPDEDFDFCIDISMLLRDNIDALPLKVKANAVYIIRSSHYKKKERTICSAENIIYPPFVKKNATGTYVAVKCREKLLTYFLQNIFRKPSFRHGQLPILSRSLSDKTTIGLLPTGGGKSLTYQLSSMLQPGVTIVVDPLVSLMVDQVRGLHALRIDASDCVNSGMDAKMKAKKLNMLQNGSLQFMLLSPERYMMENFRDSLISMTEKNQIFFAYGVIDEVHCVSEWGHDFRPSYLHLGRNMINFMRTKTGRPLSVIGLTATASFDVLADVERELTLGGNLTIDSETIVRSEDDSRPELTYRIINVESDFEPLREEHNQHLLKAQSEWDLKDIVAESKRRKMHELLKQIPNDIQLYNTGDENKECHLTDYVASQFYDADNNGKFHNAGIVFCPHAHGTFGVEDNEWGTHQGISTDLEAECGASLKIGTFVGGDKPSGDMSRFNENDLNLMVATKAFGMGIDKPNVRFTINFNHPSSIESFVQEAGRAGRDKKHAIAYILYDSSEFIHLTTDKVNDLRVAILKTLNVDPIWLESYVNKFVLRSDFIALCNDNNCGKDVSQQLMTICKEKGFIESVDKDIVLWFHNNSFRGLYKEKVILIELTDRILNVKPTQLQKVQGLLIDETGNDDVLLKLDLNKNAVKILSKENVQNQYGYVFLDHLTPIFKFIHFKLAECQHISKTLIKLLRGFNDHSTHALLHPLEGVDNSEEGIYSAMSKANADGYVYVTVSWENQVQQDFEQFEESIRTEISKIAHEQGWFDLCEDRYGKFKLNLVGDFDELIAQISKCSGDARWLRYHAANNIYSRLRQLFCKKRDKDDTDKAIYRLCCIGLVEDVTIDYLSQTYELKIRKRSEEEFKHFMLDFFLKYYSFEQASKKVEQIDEQKGRNYLDKCLGFLTAFVYDNLEKKRFRAIEDMRIACEDSIIHQEAEHNDKWLKEFIHLYFNSKYARHDYEVNGECYSLSKDTDENGKEDFDTVLKYIEVVSIDNSGSEVDNLKHLYGATLLCLRAHPDNASLLLLLTYCIAFLGAGSNDTLKSNALNGYIDGFMSLYEREKSEIWKHVDRFNDLLALKAKEDFIKVDLIKNGKEALMLFIHEKKFNYFTEKYVKTGNDKDNNRNNDKNK